MIYFLLFSDDVRRLRGFEGEELMQISAKNLEEAKEIAEGWLYKSEFRYCLIFAEVPEPVRLAILDKLEGSVRYFSSTLAGWL